MSYVIAATWKAKPDEEEAVFGLLRKMAVETRKEPGCILFRVHRALDDPRTFFLYEQFESQEALRAHADTDHFRRYVRDDALNRLESRQRQVLELVDSEEARSA